MATGEFDFTPCLERVRQQDQDAAQVLVEQLYPLVIRIVRTHLPSRSAEEDLAQEIFLKLFARLDQYGARAGIPFPHWVSRLAVRTCLDALRSERRRPELAWNDLTPEQAAWLEFLLVDESPKPDSSPGPARELLERFLSALPPQDRTVIQLLDLDQKTVHEISQITGRSRTIVKVRAFRARRKLKKLALTFKSQNPYEKL